MSDLPKRCVISFAQQGREDYHSGMRRLVVSLKAFVARDQSRLATIFFSPDMPENTIGCVPINRPSDNFFIPNHSDIPYGFKPFLFKMAYDHGFNQVLWCDSTIVIRGNLNKIFEIASKRGLFVGDNPGCPIPVWCSDDALDQMGCPHDIEKNQVMACCLAFDFSNQRARLVWDEWWKLCNDGITFAGRSGSTRPNFRAHRHDQAALSWLCQKYGIEYEPYGMLAYHADYVRNPEKCIIANTGVYEAAF